VKSNPQLDKALQNLAVGFGNLAPMTTKLSIQDALSEVSEINYEGNQTLRLQRLGAVAIKDLMAQFAKAGTVDDYKLIALALTRLHDLQVRDYAMGLTNSENIDQSFNFWHWLLQIAPTGFIAPVAAIFSTVAYESGENQLAQRSLDQAFTDQSDYALAKLLRRVYSAGWPPQSFAAMRAELHPKVCATLFG
jgi:hypothetical protein